MKIRFFILVFIVSFQFKVFAQNPVDSMLAYVQNQHNADSARYMTAGKLYYYFRGNDLAKAKKMLDVQFNISQKINRYTGMAGAMLSMVDYYVLRGFNDSIEYCLNKAEEYYIKGEREEALVGVELQRINFLLKNKRNKEAFKRIQKVDSAIAVSNQAQYEVNLLLLYTVYYENLELYDRAVSYAKRRWELVKTNEQTSSSSFLSNIGGLYYRAGNQDSAVHYYTKALSEAKKYNDQRSLMKAYDDLAWIYMTIREYPQAYDFLRDAMQLAKKMNNPHGIQSAYSRMGLYYSSQENYDSALFYHNRGLEIAQYLKDEPMIARSYSSIGTVYQALGDYDQAIAYEKKSLDYLEASKQPTRSIGYASLANMYLEKGQKEKALSTARNGLRLAKESGNQVYIKICAQSLGEICLADDRHEEALDSYMLYWTAKDSLSDEKGRRELISFDLRLDYERQTYADSIAQEKVRHGLELAHQEELVEEARTQNILMGTAALLLILAGGGWSRSRYIKKSNAKLKVERERAERSERFKQRFLANMSHEIRTPMNAIVGLVELVLDGRLSKKQRQYLDVVQSSSENLLVIVNDILDLSKIEEGKMIVENVPFDFERQLELLGRTFEKLAASKKLNLSFSNEQGIRYLKGDPTRLHQVLVNLIGNAIKFTEKGGVKVDSFYSEGKLKIIVSDTGIGIASDQLDLLFESFQQLDGSTSRKYGGTGLGLTISKELIGLMGGTIEVESTNDVGSTFTILLPFELTNDKPSSMELSEHKVVSGLKILVVEDNEINQMVIHDTLLQLLEDPFVDLVDTGKGAIQALKDRVYDIVFMDIHMPEMDGYETTKMIRKELTEPIASIPIVALTASVLKDEVEECINAGMNDVLPKPFKRSELLSILVKHQSSSSSVDKKVVTSSFKDNN